MAKDNVIQFPTLTEANKLRESMEELEKAIKSNLDDLQQINEEIVQLTVVYEDMLHRLCELTGVKLPLTIMHLETMMARWTKATSLQVSVRKRPHKVLEVEVGVQNVLLQQ